jgi:hypothetical protein
MAQMARLGLLVESNDESDGDPAMWIEINDPARKPAFRQARLVAASALAQPTESRAI